MARAKKAKATLNAKEIARAVTEQLPGWRLAPKKVNPVHDASRAAVRSTQSGASLKDLRQKYLGQGSAGDADSNRETEQYGAKPKGMRSVRVQPKKGGPSKVADIIKGKVKIVQG